MKVGQLIRHSFENRGSLMRIVSYIFCLIVLWSPTTAQNDRNPDARATSILKNLEKNMQALTDVTYLFALDISRPETESQTKNGIFFTQGDKYRLELEPFLFITDATSQWVVDKKSLEIQIHDYIEQSDDLTNPQNLLAIYNNENFDYRLLFEGAQGDMLIQQIEFKPLERTSEYSKGKLTIDKRTGYISEIEVFGKDGSKYMLHIKETKPNSGLVDSLFVVEDKDFSGFQKEDLRLN